MYLSDIFLARHSEIPGLNQCAVDVLTLDLSHLLFKEDSQVFADEFRIDGDDLNNFMPELKELAADLIDILHQLEGDLERVVQVHSLRERDQ